MWHLTHSNSTARMQCKHAGAGALPMVTQTTGFHLSPAIHRSKPCPKREMPRQATPGQASILSSSLQEGYVRTDTGQATRADFRGRVGRGCKEERGKGGLWTSGGASSGRRSPITTGRSPVICFYLYINYPSLPLTAEPHGISLPRGRDDWIPRASRQKAQALGTE